MNKNCYRIIFNKARGLLMAVAETCLSQGKASGETFAPSKSNERFLIAATILTIRPLAFFVWGLLGMVMTPAATAQIVADINNSGVIAAQNNTALSATGASSQITSASGAVLAAEANVQVDEAHQHKGRSSAFSSKTITTRDTLNQTTAQATTFSGKTTTVLADRDIKRIDIVEARNTSQSQTETKFKQSGLTVALTNPVVSAIQTADQMKSAASKTSDPRMQALALATTALAAKNAVDAVQANPSEAGGVNLSISVGTSKSQSNIPTMWL